MIKKVDISTRQVITNLTAVLLVALSQFVSAATLKQVTGFGDNPSNLQMFLYIPDKVVTHPPILVALHWCHGTANSIYTGNQFPSLAEKYGFIIIYPNANSKDSCWDVQSTKILAHNGGGDASGIVSMVKYVIKNNNGDSNRVYVSGHSSGGMMTNIMCGSYPDVFKAGAASAGVAFGCFAAGPVDSYGWCANCAQGKVTKTAAQWGDIVRAAYPGYTGPRPRMQLWHGANDDILNIINLTEEIKQWTNVHGISETPTTTESNMPKSPYTRTRYKNSSGTVLVEAINEAGQGHNCEFMVDQIISFLGLNNVTGVENGSIGTEDNKAQGVKVTVNRQKMSGSLNFMVSSFTGRIGLVLYDLNGKKIHTIAEQYSSTGKLELSWDGRINKNNVCPIGVYILSVTVNGSAAGSCPLNLIEK